jgi:hypothetical protein
MVRTGFGVEGVRRRSRDYVTGKVRVRVDEDVLDEREHVVERQGVLIC